MVKSGNITITDGRVIESWVQLNNLTQTDKDKKIETLIKSTGEGSKIWIGEITCFYPYLDKMQVQIKNGQLVLCKILHRLGGSLIDYYTPEGEWSYDNELKEPCVVPVEKSSCLVASVHNDDEWCFLGFYTENELNVTPALEGHYKIMGCGVNTENCLDFSNTQLNIKTENDDGYCTRSEVEQMIDELREELK